MGIDNSGTIKTVAVETLIPYARNARTHSDEQVAQIAASIREFGWTNPILVDGANGIIAGHGRLAAARKLGLAQVPVIELAHLTETQKRAYILADNQLATNAGWDMEMLKVELSDLDGADFDLDLLGFGEDFLAEMLETEGEGSEEEEGGAGSGKMADKFLIAPFSVLNAREGWWQDRKRAWLNMGIKSEVGRGENSLGFSNACINVPNGRGYAECLKTGIGEKYGRTEQTGTSIFDPVLCEIAYRWFTPQGGIILDPFAGGSVRGIVAAKLGMQYIGHELRPEQVAANREQAEEIFAGCENMPVWVIGDSRNIDKTCADVEADFIFSCPPYADLEVYSDDPQDLSTLQYEVFRDAYFEIIKKATARLKQDRFACFVVGEVRDKRGNYYDFVGDTVQAFKEAGLEYYNEAVLITAIGSLPIRAGRVFSASRKLGKTHQNVLGFVKGDGKKAAQACGDVEISMPEGLDQEE